MSHYTIQTVIPFPHNQKLPGYKVGSTVRITRSSDTIHPGLIGSRGVISDVFPGSCLVFFAREDIPEECVLFIGDPVGPYRFSKSELELIA